MSSDDIIIWADGTWCFAENLAEYGFMSDDYERVPFGTAKWQEFLAKETDDAPKI